MTYCRFCLQRPSSATTYYHSRPLETCVVCHGSIRLTDLFLLRLACQYAWARGDVVR